MSLIGSSRPIDDAFGKATGSTRYAGDLSFPGMAHLAMVFSSVPHAFVRRIDDTEALAMDGVYGVFHCFNTTERRFCRYRRLANQPDLPDQERVFAERVRFVGDRVAAVAACDVETARRAARTIRVEYEELPYALDADTALRGVIDDLHDDGAVYGDYHVEVGDAPQLGADCVVMETKSVIERVNHIAMETHVCVSDYDRESGMLTIYSPNQAVFGIRTVIADLFGLPYPKVRVVKTTMGGSFGAKQEWVLEPVVAAVTLALKRPVKLVYTREETMRSTYCRCPLAADVKTAFTRDGLLRSVEIDATLDAGAYLGNTFAYARTIASKLYRCYRYPYASYTGRAVCTNTPVSGAFRGWTAPEFAIMIEHNFNMAARRLGIDPLELRLRNVATPADTDLYYRMPMGEVRTRECLELGRDVFLWQQKQAEDKSFNMENIRFRRGVGVACGGHVNGFFPYVQDFTRVDMRMAEDGGVMVNASLHDHGCGTVTACKMIVAETLGIPYAQVELSEADTAVTPFDYGCYSSRTTYVIGRAMQKCAEQLLALILDQAAAILDLPRSSLYAQGGYIRCRQDNGLCYPFAKVACDSHLKLQKEVFTSCQYINPSNPGVTGAHFAHVEVDAWTGMTRILDYLAVHDIGRAINREICIAQIQGAVLMGCGAALCERMPVRQDGRALVGLKNYHLINSSAAPNVQVALIEDGLTDGPFGAKSIGEAAHVPVAPAVAGAVNEALQSELYCLPLYADRIMKVLAEEAQEG